MSFRLFRRRQDAPVTHINVDRPKKGRFFLWAFLVIIFAVVSWVSVTGIIAIKNISAKNTSDAPSFFRLGGEITPEQLSGEGDSRINILAAGVDKAAGLTDSLQIISIDPVNNQLAMLSIPRDLYVTDPNGVKSKINEVYNRNKKTCAKKTSTCDPAVDYGAQALKETVDDALGVTIHFFSSVDFDGLKKIVDAVGGLDVTVSQALYDPEFPCDNNPAAACGYSQAAGKVHMTGAQVLKYSRCRKGTCGNDFGRAERQQQVLALLKDRIISAGVLTNPKKLTDLISIAGTHLRTDVGIDEATKLLKLIEKVTVSEANKTVLDNSAEGPLKSSTNSIGQFVLVPKKGADDFSEVKEYVQSVLPEPYIIKEGATVAIVNASGKPETGTKVKAKLEKLGYNITSLTIAETTKPATTLTQNKNKPYTVALLKKRFIASNAKGGVNGADVTLTIGTSYVVK